jgi:YfiH family protein
VVRHPFSLILPFADRFDVALFTKDDAINGDDAVARMLGSKSIATLAQVHGTQTVQVDAPMRRAMEADGMISATPGLWLCSRAADCQLFVVYAPKQHKAGILHAGWRGVRDGAVASFIRQFDDVWQITAKDLIVGIGPSLCCKCAEFSDPATELAGIDKRYVDGRHANLQGIADAMLQSLGIPPAQIERNADCTSCRADQYWSYRGGDREAVQKGYANVVACRLRP